MAHHLKHGASASDIKAADTKVRATVEAILADIEARGDKAIAELSEKFDGWVREDFRLSPAEIDACLGQLTKRDLDDSHREVEHEDAVEDANDGGIAVRQNT